MIEELIVKLRDDVAVVIVTHNLQQAFRVADYVGFMYLGDLVEYASATTVFGDPQRAANEGVRERCVRLARSARCSRSGALPAGSCWRSSGCETTQDKAARLKVSSERKIAGREPVEVDGAPTRSRSSGAVLRGGGGRAVVVDAAEHRRDSRSTTCR